MSADRCASPLPLATLVDYWAGALAATAAEQVEEHVFDCDGCSRRLEGVAEVARGVAQVVRRHPGLQMVVTPSLLDHLARHGVRMRHYRAQPGDLVPCTVAADDDLLVTWLRADLRGIARLDVRLSDPRGHEHVRFEDVPVDAAHGELIYTMSGDLARTLPAMTFKVSLLAIDDDRERTVAEYTFEHSPLRC